MKLPLLIVTLAAGCIPYRATVRPEQTGRIVDFRSGRPVAGATVVVESWQVGFPPSTSIYRKLLHTIEARTDSQGRWWVPREKDWTVGILAADGFPLFVGSACVWAPGYQAGVINPWSQEHGPEAVERGVRFGEVVPDTITLEPRPGAAPLPAPKPGQSRCGIPLEGR
jgi:hypothetical protein